MLRHRLLLACVAGAILQFQSGCLRDAPAATTVTILTGGTGGAFFPLGSDLAALYSERLEGVSATAVATVASVFNVQAIQAERGDLAFAQADVAYRAYRRGLNPPDAPYSRLRSMAVLYVNTVQIFARHGSNIRTVGDLRGQRVGVGGEPGSGTETAARTVLESYGLGYEDLKPEFLPFADLATRFERGALDAGIIVASFPISALTEINDAAELRLIPVDADAIHRIRSRFPFFKPVVIPRDTYRGQQGDVHTIGVDNLLVCRDSLPEELVYVMTRTFFQALPNLAAHHAAARMIHAAEAPAPPIPLHVGAARYYRERELIQ